MFGSFVVNKQLKFQSSLLCVDTGERGFPGPEGQKGDRCQLLSFHSRN